MRAALYCRSSKDRSDVSIDAQRRELEQLAGAKGMQVVTCYEDAVQPGSTEDRPAFRELSAAIRNRARGWSHLLVLDTSRVARGRFIAQAFKRECAKYGVQIHYAKVPEVDPISAVILESVFEAIDEVHSLMSREKGLAGMAENVRQGFRAGGRAPWGYRLVHQPTGAVRDGKPVMKSQLDLAAGHETVRQYLTARAAGVPRETARRESGIQIAATSLIGVEWNALTYAGHTVWNRHQELDRHGHRTGRRFRPRAEWLVTRGTHPALISDLQAERILTALETSEASKATRAAKAQSAGFVLAGILESEAGQPWTCRGKYYRLKAADRQRGRLVQVAAIEAPILQQVERDLRSELFTRRLLNDIREQASSAGNGVTLRREIARLTRQRENAARLATQGDDGGAYAELVREATRQIEALQRELVALEAAAGAEQDVLSLSAEDIRRELDHAGVRDLVPLVVTRVVMEADAVTARIEYGGRCPRMASPQRRVARTPLYSVVPIRRTA